MDKLALEPITKRTHEDYAALPEDGRRWELIDGVFFATPSPSTAHQRISARLMHALMTALDDAGVALVFDAPTDLILSNHDTVVPDLIVIRRDHAHVITERAVEGRPDLVVEILSPSSLVQDRKVKRDRYASFGVPEYWLVDPEAKTVDVLVLGERGYDRHAVFGEGDTLLSHHFEQVRVPLAKIFAPVV